MCFFYLCKDFFIYLHIIKNLKNRVMLKNIEKLQKELFRMECKRIDNHREMIRMDLKLRILKANINNNKK